jgi:ribose-phosphate pyrophosphokinase
VQLFADDAPANATVQHGAGPVAALFEAVGTDRIVTLDVHNPAAFENAFRCRTITLTAALSFVEFAKSLGEKNLSVVSPDPGGVKRAELFREALESACGFPITKGFVDKRRSSGIVTGDVFAGVRAALPPSRYAASSLGMRIRL